MSTSAKDPATVSDIVSAMKKDSDGTNILKESIKTFSNPDGSDKKGDAMANTPEEALVLLKQLIENTKAKTKKDKHKVKWEFKSSPHKLFNKTLDDSFMIFIVWAKMKQEDGDDNDNNDDDDGQQQDQYNVSKAFRRLQSYAEWMEEEVKDLTEPELTTESVKAPLDAFKMRVSYDKDGNFVWWLDLKAIDTKAIKKDLKPEDSLRAFVWYCHYVMFDKAAQEKGMVIMENCGQMGFFELFNLLPMKLSAKLDRLMIGVLPVKCNKILITEGTGWMKLMMKFMGMFVSKKMMSRIVFLEEWDEVGKLLGDECIPKNFGKLEGQLEVDPVMNEYFSN